MKELRVDPLPWPVDPTQARAPWDFYLFGTSWPRGRMILSSGYMELLEGAVDATDSARPSPSLDTASPCPEGPHAGQSPGICAPSFPREDTQLAPLECRSAGGLGPRGCLPRSQPRTLLDLRARGQIKGGLQPPGPSASPICP